MKKNKSYKALFLIEQNEIKNKILSKLNRLPVSITFVQDEDDLFEKFENQKYHIAFLSSELLQITKQDFARKLKLIEVKKGLRIPPLFFLYKEKESAHSKVAGTWLRFHTMDTTSFLKNLVGHIIEYSDLSITEDSQSPLNNITPDLLCKFAHNRFEDVEVLRLLIQAKNFSEIQRMGHTLKGVCSMYGFSFLGSVAKDLEDAAVDSNINKCQSLFHDFQLEVSRIPI